MKKIQIYEVQNDFPFAKLKTIKPTPVLGEPNQYLIRMNIETDPIYIQTPPCNIKQGGFTKIGKNRYCDFIFTHDNNSMIFLDWLEKIERFSQKSLFDNQSQWFDTQLTTDDVDNMFVSPFKIFKSSQFYTLRTLLPLAKTMKIFDEQTREVPHDDNFQTEQKVIAILEIVGVRCSTKHFQIEIEMKQMMMIQDVLPFSGCIIKPNIQTPETHKYNLDEPKVDEPEITTSKQPALQNDETTENITSTIPQFDNLEKELEEVNIFDNLENFNEKINLLEKETIFKNLYLKSAEKLKTFRDLGIANYFKSKGIKNENVLFEYLLNEQ